MKILLMLIVVSIPNVFACDGDYIDPDGKDVYFYEECLHVERKFNDQTHNKCKQYSEEKIRINSMI